MGASEGKSDEIGIGLYEPWMREQVVGLFCSEYGRSRESQDELMQAFYEHPWQAEHGLRLVALDGKTVAGFQSFFAWPYEKDGQRIESFQSGNSLVHPDYRGRGVFRRLLDHLDELKDSRRIDCLVGVPVEMSFGSFIRNGWTKVVDVSWFVRPLNPLALFRAMDVPTVGMEREPLSFGQAAVREGFVLSRDPGFLDWRRTFGYGEAHRSFRHVEGEREAGFELKLNRRGRVNELIVGRVLTTHRESDFLTRALRALLRAARKERVFALVSLAMNPAHDPELVRAVRRAWFVPIRKSFPFIVKDFAVGEDLVRPELWELYRSDVDTW